MSLDLLKNKVNNFNENRRIKIIFYGYNTVALLKLKKYEKRLFLVADLNKLDQFEKYISSWLGI
ncbi:hypothetical protein [Spiroplasma sp. SV19]|uniref:hypothetical protein n=1 Tax=Spiroplasma sp. SV19 TaxID=2570468 RepID=UPI0024B7B1E7|nr:hypothetical protein [Spiroplasma sp. SV19]WHQ36385.1 hypothetical protein E7Y35_00285 [Spiroplasma sp. SV19]